MIEVRELIDAEREPHDPDNSTELNLDRLEAVSGGMLSNLANMRHEMMKTVANNLRA